MHYRALFLGLTLLAASVSLAESTRTLKIELSGDPSQPFIVENLVGVMKVILGDGSQVVASATVHAESDAIANLIRFEQVRDDGQPALRVIYPTDRHRRFRYPEAGRGWTKYDGVRVRVSRSGGVLVYADVEVRVPKAAVSGTFKNHIGRLEAENVEGRARFDTGSGSIVLRACSGEIEADTGSGDIEAIGIKRSLSCDTGSGSCEIRDFDGDTLSCDTGSGAIRASGVVARSVKADTGSGSVRIERADIEELRADTGSGSIELENTGARLRRVTADTGSGDVRLFLPPSTTFEARAEQGSGSIRCRFDDAKAIVVGREVVGYRRGDAATWIEVDTGSGDLVIAPVR